MSVSGGTMSGRRAAIDPYAATLAMLQDADKVKARLKQIADAEASMRQVTEQFEGIANLNRMKANAKRAKERAEEALGEAEARAKTIVAEAEESASNLRQAVQGEKAEFEKESRRRFNELIERESNLASNEADYQRRNAANDRREGAIATKATANADRKKELERLANRLKAVCNEVLA